MNLSLQQRLSTSPLVIRATKISHKFVDHRLLKHAFKSPAVTAVTFGLVFFFLCADNFASNFSFSYHSNDDSGGPLSRVVHEISRSNVPDSGSGSILRSLPAEGIYSGRGGATEETILEDPKSLIPPFNATRIERLAWFREKIPDIEIFNPNPLTEQFHSRVLQFLNNNCSIQFFMIWNSPARSFKNRDFLAIDSLFSSNPRGCLLIISRTMDTRRGYSILKPIIDRGFKVLAVTPDLPFLMKNTPTESWFEQLRSGRRDPGGYIVQNLANLIRFAMLYKYGGVYLDTDFIVLKDFSGLRNVVDSQTQEVDTKNWLNGAAIAFDVGHLLLKAFLEEFANTYNGNRWGNNGPHLMTRVIQRTESTPECNYKVLQPEAFYPVDWVKIKRLFRGTVTEADKRWAKQLLAELENGDTYGVHLWNKLTVGMKIEVGSVVGRLMEQHCLVCENIYT
ncbi:hypothetical protein SAY87_031838 [Trapa incisa]|uniref:Alpha 1,4-glycosyltransferase domain-containing protein n=1 Tax=Trapa incisa TaxID=236973 RepID=A0AAN7KXY7_9MYRT|nr:hypothetical protein SAY87_031838 [Trapa incisa]